MDKIMVSHLHFSQGEALNLPLGRLEVAEPPLNAKNRKKKKMEGFGPSTTPVAHPRAKNRRKRKNGGFWPLEIVWPPPRATLFF
jgi:hypothetical protein